MIESLMASCFWSQLNWRWSERYRGRSCSLLAIVLLFSGPVQAEELPQNTFLELRVENPGSADRQGELVSTGLPLPRYNLGARTDLAGLSMVDDSGNEVPLQLEVLSRWGGPVSDTGMPVKWLLASFPVDLAASESRSFFLLDQPGAMPGQVARTSSPSALTVKTGAMKVEFPTVGGSLLSGVWIDGERIAERGYLELRDAAGVPLAVQLESSEFEVAGSVRTVVKQQVSMPALGLSATLRYRLHSGSSRMQVEVRLENHGTYGSPYAALPAATRHFDSLELVVQLAEASRRVASPREIYQVSESSFEVQQRYTQANSATQVLSGFEYDALLGGAVMESGDTFEGGLAVDQVIVVVDRFWQTFPKSLAIEGRNLRVGLFPAFGNGAEFRGQYESPPDVTGTGGSGTVLDPLDSTAYRFEGGRWSSHSLELGFSTMSLAEPARVQERIEGVAEPLLAQLSQPRWAFEVFAFGEPQVPRSFSPAPRFEQMQDALVDNDAADEVQGQGRIGLRNYRTRGGRWGGRQMYGWQNFGDLSGSYGYTSAHYDLPYSMLLNYFRTGERAFFDTGRDLIRHRRDYDQYHSRDPADPRRGGQYLDKGYWHGNSGAPSGAATWVHGLLLWHVMTGDPGAREAAVEVGEFIDRQSPETWNGYWGAEQIGWQLEALVHLYNYLGNPSYLQQAKRIVGRWVELERAQPTCGDPAGCGYVLNPAFNPGAANVPAEFVEFYQQSWTVPAYQPMSHAIVAQAMAKLYFVDLDQETLEALSRLGDQLANHAMVAADPAAQTGPWFHGRLCFAGDQPLAGPSFALNPSTHDGWAVVTALVYRDFAEAFAIGNGLSQQAADEFSALYDFLVDQFQLPPGAVIGDPNPVGWHSSSGGVRQHAQRSLWGSQLSALIRLYGQATTQIPNCSAQPCSLNSNEFEVLIDPAERPPLCMQVECRLPIGNAIEIQIDPTAPS